MPLANLRFATPAGEAAALLRATSSDPILWIPVPAALTLSYQMRFWMALLGLGFCAIYVYALAAWPLTPGVTRSRPLSRAKGTMDGAIGPQPARARGLRPPP